MTGALDGMTFDIVGRDIDSGSELEDEIIFRDGTFQSVDCQKYCDFGWTDYKTKVVDDVLHFTVTTVCPDAPHTVVWYGTVENGQMDLDVTWTTRRWYWTHQIAIEGGGTVMEDASSAVSG